VLGCVEWIAPGFEIVQSHFPDWKCAAADCTAAFGLHGALVVGTPLPVTDANRATLAATLPLFALTLERGGAVIDRGVGANVLDSPALALAHLAQVLARQPQFPPLAAGEIVTTGTLTDAWPVAPGETWSSDYGALGLPGVTLTFG
jgi:2-oxo-3-hexenedioate decarboxylase